MDPVALAKLVTNTIGPALPIIYAGGQIAMNKSGDMILEECIKKLGSKAGKKARTLLDKISPKMSKSLEKALINASKNSEDSKAKEELQQEISELLKEDPSLAKEIENIIININPGNISQLTIGSDNPSYNFENHSGNTYVQFFNYTDEIKKETANQNNLRHYNPSILPEYSERLKQFVTENRSEELKKALTYLEKHKILLISGVGGVGKTTLARALVDYRPENVPEAFWFSFYSDQDAKLSDILEKLAAYMNAPEIASFKAEKREPRKSDVDILTGELLKRSEVWLIFDDLSIMLDDQQFVDKGIEILFYSLRYNTHNARVIITSRILPIFENGESLLDSIDDEEKQSLSGLTTDFAVNYLSSNGLNKIEHEELEELAKGVDGHPFALKILLQLVKDYGTADILSDLSICQEKREDTIKKARKLFDKLAGEEKELLERISVYREPIKLKCLRKMFTEKTPRSAVTKLKDKSLLETDNNGNYWLHPLVQEFSYIDLKNKKEVHKIAMEYYLPLPISEKPAKKEDVQSLVEAYHHAYMAEEYDQAFDIIFDNNLYELLDIWGNYTLLIDLYSKFLPKDHLGKETLLEDKGNHGVILKNLGNSYYRLGNIRKAIEYHEQALVIAREIGDRRDEGNNLGNLGNAYNDLGEPRKAIEYYGQALVIAREIGNRRNEGIWLGNLGSAYRNLGDTRKAIEYYEQALVIAREIGDRRNEGIWLGNLENAYNDLRDTRKVIEYHEALVTARETGNRRNEGNNLGISVSFGGNYLIKAAQSTAAVSAPVVAFSSSVVVAAIAPVVILGAAGYGVFKVIEKLTE